MMMLRAIISKNLRLGLRNPAILVTVAHRDRIIEDHVLARHNPPLMVKDYGNRHLGLALRIPMRRIFAQRLVKNVSGLVVLEFDPLPRGILINRLFMTDTPRDK